MGDQAQGRRRADLARPASVIRFIGAVLQEQDEEEPRERMTVVAIPRWTRTAVSDRVIYDI